MSRIPSLKTLWTALAVQFEFSNMEKPKLRTEEGLEVAKENYFETLRPAAWNLVEALYNAKSITPERLETPAVIVFPLAHLASPDPLLAMCLKQDYVVGVYKKASALASKASRYVGGVEVNLESKRPVDFRYVNFLMDHDAAIVLFPFTDVDGQSATGMLEWLLRYDNNHDTSISYYSGAIVWTRNGKEITSLDNNRIPYSQWPKWWSNEATVLIGGQPLKSEGRTVEDMLDAISDGASTLRDAYLAKQV